MHQRPSPKPAPDQFVDPIAMTLFEVHESWAWVAVIGNGLAGAWCLGALKKPALRSRAMWWFVGVAQFTMMIQVVLGVLLVTAKDAEPVQFHMFYGFIALIAIGIIYSYRDQMMHRIYLLYGFGSLFITGLGIRAVLIGAAPPL